MAELVRWPHSGTSPHLHVTLPDGDIIRGGVALHVPIQLGWGPIGASLDAIVVVVGPEAEQRADEFLAQHRVAHENAILRQREAEVRTLMKRVVNLGFGATDDDVRVVEELKDRAEAWLKATEDGEKP